MKIALDLDGVLGDFVGATAKLLNFDPRLVNCWDYYPKVGTTKTAFWAAIHAQGHGFWEGIDPYPWCQTLYRSCKRVCPTQILTSPSDDIGCYSGKAAWIKKHLFLKPDEYMLGAAKHWVARPDTVLVDDSDENCRMFQEHGGHAILFPQPWNENRKLSESRMEYTLEKLAELEGVIK